MRAPLHHHLFRATLALWLLLVLAGSVWWVVLQWDDVAALPSGMGPWLRSLTER